MAVVACYPTPAAVSAPARQACLPTPTASAVASGEVAIKPPRPLCEYALSASAVTVSTSAELITALRAATSGDIILADGDYDGTVPFENFNGHRLHAQHLLGARLHAGILIGSNSGNPNAVIEGIAFDVSDRAKTFQGAILFISGPRQHGVRISDSTFSGHGLAGSAILARQPDGLVVQRVVIRDFTDWGIVADTNQRDTVLSKPLLIEDVDVSGVSRAVPRSANGTAEACIGIGNTGTVRRARVRGCAWMGITTFNASHGALLEDLDIDGSPFGVFVEHYTSASTFQRMRIGPNVETGIISEGTDPSGKEWGGIPSSIDNIIQDSTIESSTVGLLMGWATTRTTVRGVTFRNQSTSAIREDSGVDNSFYDNDYSEIQPGAVEIDKRSAVPVPRQALARGDN